ncbi:MAG TPA: hypothetical protein VFS20_08715 [Longimicrobium sp.]|nr:hypothetical protein [Longimicrobium sp.]
MTTAFPAPPAAPPCAKHERDLVGFLGSERPVILQRTDQDFIAAVLDELKTPDGHRKLLSGRAATRDASGRLRLFQPVHRTFHLVLLEAFCRELGNPRLDPAKIESAGLVVRRVIPSTAQTFGKEDDAQTWGWMRDETRIVGWDPLNTEALQDRDPDPERRPAPLKTTHPELSKRLAAFFRPNPLAETVSPLFVAPPEVCKAAGRTVLYGVVPVTSTEISEAPRQTPAYPLDDVRALLPDWLKAGSWTWRALEELEAPPTPQTAPTKADLLGLLSTIGFFSETAEAAALRTAMDRVTVRYGTPAPINKVLTWPHVAQLGGELWKAEASLLDKNAPRRVNLPAAWTITAADAEAILLAAQAMLTARMAAAKPVQTRFEMRDALFRVRAFIRVKQCNDCPPRLVWSEPSEPFSIVPWYESGDLPPVRVALPEANRDALKKLKPNVTFVTPKSVADLMQGMGLKDLTAGNVKAPPPEGSGAPGAGLDWLCGFSIPIITLCAFIVLQIFLALLHILFWWLPIVKICIPIPKLTPPQER